MIRTPELQRKTLQLFKGMPRVCLLAAYSVHTLGYPGTKSGYPGHTRVDTRAIGMFSSVLSTYSGVPGYQNLVMLVIPG